MENELQSLSPAAQAVLQAYEDNYDKFAALAAVLRALDSQLGYNVLGVRAVDSSQIELIAAELDAI